MVNFSVRNDTWMGYSYNAASPETRAEDIKLAIDSGFSSDFVRSALEEWVRFDPDPQDSAFPWESDLYWNNEMAPLLTTFPLEHSEHGDTRLAVATANSEFFLTNMKLWSVADAIGPFPQGMSKPSSPGYYATTYGKLPNGVFADVERLARNSSEVNLWAISHCNKLVRTAKRSTRAGIYNYLRTEEKVYASSLAGRLAISAPASAKCRNVFNFSPPGNLSLALSSKPFYETLKDKVHPPYHNADPLSDHRHFTGAFGKFSSDSVVWMDLSKMDKLVHHAITDYFCDTEASYFPDTYIHPAGLAAANSLLLTKRQS